MDPAGTFGVLKLSWLQLCLVGSGFPGYSYVYNGGPKLSWIQFCLVGPCFPGYSYVWWGQAGFLLRHMGLEIEAACATGRVHRREMQQAFHLCL